MKYTIHGFSQQVALELGLDNDSLLLLRWLCDFSGTSKMEHIEVNGKIYYWVNYKTVCEDLPIISPNKQGIYRKLKKLCDAKVLKHHTVKVDGTYSYYAFNETYDQLISDDYKGGFIKNDVGGTSKLIDRVHQKRSTKDLSTKYNPSTKETTTVKNVVVDTAIILDLQKDIKNVIGATVSKTAITDIVTVKGISQINYYLANWDKFKEQPMRTIAGFFKMAVLSDYVVPVVNNATINAKVPQETNYEQRKYDDAFYNSLYDNT